VRNGFRGRVCAAKAFSAELRVSIRMRGAGWILGIFLLFSGGVPLLVAPPPVSAMHVGGSSTETGVRGELKDIEIDLARARLYISDTGPFFGGPAVRAVDLETHREVGSFAVSGAAGVELSPSGARLAIAAEDSLHIIDPASLQSIGRVSLSAQGWDLAFDGEQRVVVSLLGGNAAVVNLATMAVESRFTNPPYGFLGPAAVRIDPARRLAYMVEFGRISVFDLTTSPPTRVLEKQDPAFTASSVLSPDGLRLFFSTGTIYAALNLSFVASTGHSGDPFLDPSRPLIFYSRGVRIDEVDLATYGRLHRFAFGGQPNYSLDYLRTFAVDSVRNMAYVVNGDSFNGRTLHAVPLRPAILDPQPPDGFSVAWDPVGVSVVLSSVDPATVAMSLDGGSLSTSYDPYAMRLGTLVASNLGEGIHSALAVGQDDVGTTVRLGWTFRVDRTPPVIAVEASELVFREPIGTVRGRITDATFAWADGAPLVLGPGGNFTVTRSLVEGLTNVQIRAVDAAGLEASENFGLLYVPPTRRYQDADAQFSVEYPENWTVESDVVFQGITIEVLMRKPAVVGGGTSLNVIDVGPCPDCSAEFLARHSDELIANLSVLPGFTLMEAPTIAELPNVAGITYAYYWRANGTTTSQRQYVLVSDVVHRAWVLTFSTDWESFGRYDSMFRWMAGTFRPEAASNSPLVMIAVVGGIGVTIAAVIAAAVVIILRRRRKPPMVALESPSDRVSPPDSPPP